ncbi:hypothetical protein ORJ04_19040 [Rheinheimera baltica]|uniref:Uncharacterized protein n=1 Tax=Rheinheimera baltica TaxID=67576 RepID=A0ABT9I3U9_9GAMM|nr:hypothetical protein [Rheinheimera baltica]MDP5138049.1 hypothetical protein [Rheinheimera baltica]MDP5141977.1 hypothetical protein [Rheinheimera baltica]MDP5150034.1 hypothetical protein [Rheinheimera baltica]
MEQQLLVLPLLSHGWYRVKGFQLDYMFDQHQFLSLQAEADYTRIEPELLGTSSKQLYQELGSTLLLQQKISNLG